MGEDGEVAMGHRGGEPGEQFVELAEAITHPPVAPHPAQGVQVGERDVAGSERFGQKRHRTGQPDSAHPLTGLGHRPAGGRHRPGTDTEMPVVLVAAAALGLPEELDDLRFDPAPFPLEAPQSCLGGAAIEGEGSRRHANNSTPNWCTVEERSPQDVERAGSLREEAGGKAGLQGDRNAVETANVCS